MSLCLYCIVSLTSQTVTRNDLVKHIEWGLVEGTRKTKSFEVLERPSLSRWSKDMFRVKLERQVSSETRKSSKDIVFRGDDSLSRVNIKLKDLERLFHSLSRCVCQLACFWSFELLGYKYPCSGSFLKGLFFVQTFPTKSFVKPSQVSCSGLETHWEFKSQI